MKFSKAIHIINTLYRSDVQLFTDEEIREARIKLGIIQEEEL